jgi:hypothetical protein
MCPTLLFHGTLSIMPDFFILCLTPDELTHQGDSTAIKCVNGLIKVLGSSQGEGFRGDAQ